MARQVCSYWRSVIQRFEVSRNARAVFHASRVQLIRMQTTGSLTLTSFCCRSYESNPLMLLKFCQFIIFFL